MSLIITALQAWLASLLSGLGIIAKPRFLVRYSETNPAKDTLAEPDFVIVRSGDFPKWAVFRCPCGCGDKLSLSLVSNRRPSWRVTADCLGRPTVSPSVWQRGGCHSHFWLRRGNVEWCPATGEPHADDGGGS